MPKATNNTNRILEHKINDCGSKTKELNILKESMFLISWSKQE